MARDEGKLASTAAAMRVETGGTIDTLPLDITEPSAAERIADHVARAGGYVDILVNNAGIGLSGPFVTLEPREVERLLALNVTALTRMTRAFLPAMLARAQGGVINIASLGGYAPGPYQAAYYASKAYVLSLSEAISHEVRGQGVRVLAVAPGPVNTDFHKKMGSDRALYRYFVIPVSSDRVARSTMLAYRLGRRISRPGILSPLLLWSLRIIPHNFTVPLVGLLLWRPQTLATDEIAVERPPK